MAIINRSRNRSVSRLAGKFRHSSTAAGGGTQTSWTDTESCLDVVGHYGEQNQLYIEKSNNLAWFLTGRSRSGSPYYHYEGGCFNNAAPSWLTPSMTIPSNNSALAEGLAKSNVNAPVVDIPLFLKEMIDIPRSVMFYTREIATKFGSRPIRTSAGGILEYEFGLRLFFGDIQKMLDFTNQTEKRFQELKAIQRNGDRGTRRARNTFSNHTYGSPYWLYVTTLNTEQNTRHLVTVREDRQWVSTNWVPQIDLSKYNDNKLRHLANRLVYSRNITWDTLYNAMPWTWLLDWFSNVGDVVSLSRNTLPVSHNGSCVMRMSVIRVEDKGHRSGTGTYNIVLPTWRRVIKERTPMTYGPLPEFNIPFLTGRQLSILGSIGVTRRR